MYPIHWYETTDCINYGFSLSNSVVSYDERSNREIAVLARDPASDPLAFTISTHIYMGNLTAVTPVKMVVRHEEIEARIVVANKYALSNIPKGMPCAMSITVDYLHNRSSSSRTFRELTFEFDAPAKSSYHVAILFYNNRPHLYVNTEQILPTGDVVSVGSQTNWYTENGFATNELNLMTDNGKYIWVKSTKYSFHQHFKYYDKKASKQQLLEDCEWIVAHYLMDGFEADTNGNCMLERDVSGAASYDLVITGNPMVMSPIGNHMRDTSMIIPDGCVFSINQIPHYSQIFVNLWVRFDLDTRNGMLYKHGEQVELEYMYDDTGYSIIPTFTKRQGDTVERIAPNESFHVNAEEWVMLSLWYQKLDTNAYDAEVLINGESVLKDTFSYDDSYTTGWFTTNPIDISPFPGQISDIKITLKRPLDEELRYMYNGDVLIDDRGTFCANKLIADSEIETFGFGKGEILARGFEFLEEENENSAFFDPSDGILKIRDFKQL